MSALTVTTAYETRPGSNVGKHVARSLGMQFTLVDQSVADPHRAAAVGLIERINDKLGTTYVLGAEAGGGSEDGQTRVFEVEG